MALRHALTEAATRFSNTAGLSLRRNTPATAYQQVKTEEDYELNGNGNGPLLSGRRSKQGRGAHSVFALCNRRLVLTVLGLLGFLILIAHILPTSRRGDTQTASQAHHKLYLVIPAFNDPDLGFCRTELTAAILGYPTPHVLNHEASGRSKSEQERDKIRLINDHLNGLANDDKRASDLVILLDGASSWFQLRPEVLVKRYYDIIEQAERRLKRKTGKDEPPAPRIVFSAQDHCSTNAPDRIACFAPPESPLGPESTLRFLDGGLAIGPVPDMHRLFNKINGKVISRMDEETSQQALLAEIFGEQEFHREFLRQGSWWSSKSKLRSVLQKLGYSKASSITDAVPGRQVLENPESTGHEMGMELDYENLLGLLVSRNTEKGSVDWIQHSLNDQQVSSTLPDDIESSMPPFWTTTSSSLPLEKSWADVPLLTSKRTGGIPAIINVANKQRGSNTAGLDWRTLWLHAHARELFEKQNEIPRLPLMSVLDGKGTQHTFWNQDLRVERNGANWQGGGWTLWSKHCGWGDSGEVIRLLADA